MATVTPIPPRTDEQVYHPLDRLRTIIRRYVVIEGVLSTLIFLGLWFALALLLDYVVFKSFTWDWVQDGTRWIRVIALVAALALLVGILVFRIARRLTTEFSYPALALVLERRYPKVLGDRLITAIEMADIDQAARYGYSSDMIRQTMQEARDKVAQVDVNAVFNWRRLRLMALLAVGIPLVIVTAAFAAHAISLRALDPVRAGWKLYHVSGILAERDLLLWNTPWPRRALLEIQGEAKDGLRIARDGAPPRVKVKAYQWVIVDRTRPDGWRPLMWSEVTDKLVGMPVPEVPFRSLGYPNEPTRRATSLGAVATAVAMEAAPDENPEFSTNADDWTVDAVYERAREIPDPERKSYSPPPQIARLKNKVGAEAFDQLQAVFTKLDTMAGDPAYGRRLRKLDKPQAVAFSYSGVKTAGTGTFTPEGNSEYAGEITGLKEDVRFVVKAEDFRTRPTPITLIPPPVLTKLAQTSFQPAYLHYAAPQGEGYAALKGLRQRMPEEKLSLTGDKSIFEVPSGTEVILTGSTEQPITSAWVIPRVGQIPGAKPGSDARVALKLTDRSAENGTRALQWSDVTPAFVGAPVPELPLQKLRLANESKTPSASAADWSAEEVVRRVRDEAPVRARLKAELGDAALAELDKVVAILDEKARDESGKYVLNLGTTFALEFTGDYRFVKRAQPYEFDLVYQNIDRVESSRPVLIHVRDDQPPVVELASDVIRRVGNVYYVTPRAKIPFVAESYIKDDNGLSKIEYTYLLYPEDSDIARSMRAGYVMRAIIPPVWTRFPAVVQGIYHAGAHSSLDRGDNRTAGSFLHGGFISEEGKLKRETKAYIERLIAEPLTGEKVELVKRYGLKWESVADRTFRPNGGLESFKWRMQGDYFDLAALKLEVASGDVQPRYRVDLNVQATDTNFDTGPRTATNTDPIRLLVVSSGDLLIEIGKEEEALAFKLDEALTRLAECRANYSFVNSKHNTRLPDEIVAVKTMSIRVSQAVAKARELVLNVGRAFRKIEKECVVNQLDDRTIAQYGKFANRIDRVLGENPEIISPDEYDAIQAGRSDATPFGSLTPRSTFPNTEKLIASVQDALEQGRYAEPGMATDADIRINLLEQEVRSIREILGEAQSKEKLIKEARALIERQRRVRQEIVQLQRAMEEELDKPSIGEVGEVALSKGESKTIKHSLAWRLYKGPPGNEDTLVVKLAASDPSIVVPAELKLDFEKNNESFTYAIRAGNKEGSYTVIVTPAVGKPVEVKVTVK